MMMMMMRRDQQSLLIGWLDCWLVGWIVHVPLRWGNRQVIEDDHTNDSTTIPTFLKVVFRCRHPGMMKVWMEYEDGTVGRYDFFAAAGP